MHVSVCFDWFDWFQSCEGYGKNLHTWKYACNDLLNMWIACLPSITPSSSSASAAPSETSKTWVYQIFKDYSKARKDFLIALSYYWETLQISCLIQNDNLKNKSTQFSIKSTQGQKSTFYTEINKNLMFEKCEFC